MLPKTTTTHRTTDKCKHTEILTHMPPLKLLPFLFWLPVDNLAAAVFSSMCVSVVDEWIICCTMQYSWHDEASRVHTHTNIYGRLHERRLCKIYIYIVVWCQRDAICNDGMQNFIKCKNKTKKNKTDDDQEQQQQTAIWIIQYTIWSAHKIWWIKIISLKMANTRVINWEHTKHVCVCVCDICHNHISK